MSGFPKGSSARRRERGAVTTIFGVLLGMGVVMGFAALSLDVGRILVEKRQLQNSADAAALSLARSCWGPSPNCVPGADNLAGLVDNNAEDRVSGIESQCSVNMPGSTMPTCGTASGALADCSPLPARYAAMAGLPYVEVRTKTQTAAASGSRTNSLRNWLGGFLGQPTGAAGACSRAAVGAAATGDSQLPIAISGCEWQRATGGTTGGGGGAYWPAPQYQGLTSPDYGYTTTGTPTWPAGAVPAPGAVAGGEVVLLVQNPPAGHAAPAACPTWNGHVLPGGFSILETAGGDPCKARSYPFSWYHTNPGSSTSCDLSQFVGKVVSIPVFTCTLLDLPSPGRNANESTDPCDTGNGTNTWYWTPGFARFYLSGYSVTTAGGVPNRKRSINPNNTLPPNANPCSTSESCLSGWFVSGSLAQATGISGPPSGSGFFGSYAVVPAG